MADDLFQPPPVICQCWLGDGRLMCDTPKECGLVEPDENKEEAA